MPPLNSPKCLSPILLIWGSVSCSLVPPWTHHVAEDDLEFLTLPSPPEGWDSRHQPTLLVWRSTGDQTQSSVCAKQAICQLNCVSSLLLKFFELCVLGKTQSLRFPRVMLTGWGRIQILSFSSRSERTPPWATPRAPHWGILSRHFNTERTSKSLPGDSRQVFTTELCPSSSFRRF